MKGFRGYSTKSNSKPYCLEDSKDINKNLSSYLAGLIEGFGTIAVHEKNSTATKYRPMIIICFKKADLPLANYLCDLTECGKVYIKPGRGYVLWQIGDIVGVFKIICIINGYFRTPKHEALQRAINWINEYIINSKNSKLPSTKLISSNIFPIECKPLDETPIESNAWLAGLTDANGNFSINVHKRKNKNSTRVQPYFRIEIRQTYHRLANSEVSSYFFVMSKIASYLGVNNYSRNRTLNDKIYYSFTVMATTQKSLDSTIHYFQTFPLLSSKHLDYLDWLKVVKLQKVNSQTSSYLETVNLIRKDFNSTRTTFTWNHLNNSYVAPVNATWQKNI